MKPRLLIIGSRHSKDRSVVAESGTFKQRLTSLYYKYEKHFQKMYRDVGMAVPKTTKTRCRDGSVQARHVIQRLHN